MLQKKTISYYDWFDLIKAVNERLGYDVDDIKGPVTGERNIFWHWWLNSHYDIPNGFIDECVDFEYFYDNVKEIGDPEEAWVLDILFALNELVDGEEVSIRYTW